MGYSTKFYIVAADALPEVFIKVAEAKRLLISGDASTVGDAARMVGISRSAYYKYKDSVQPLNDIREGRIISVHIVLRDMPGILSSVLTVFSGSGANILTINSGVPANGCAAVTITADTTGMILEPESLIEAVRAVDGVLRFEILAG